MLCVAAVRLLVVHAAVLLLPLPASATALQPVIEFAPSLKLTLPVGLLPMTVAVKVTWFRLSTDSSNSQRCRRRCRSRRIDDLRQTRAARSEVARIAAVGRGDGVRAAVSVPVVHAAVLLLPLPASATALQPAIEAPPSLKLTLPVGAVPVTVAVNVMLVPNVDGFFELTTPVVLVALLTTCETAVLAEALLPASPP